MSFKIGDRVTIDHPRFKNAGVYKIIKINPKTYGLQNETSGGKVRCSPVFLIPVKGAGAKPGSVSMAASKILVFHPGTVVSVKGRTEAHVVLSQNAKSVSVAKVGGDGGRYLRVPASALKIVNL